MHKVNSSRFLNLKSLSLFYSHPYSLKLVVISYPSSFNPKYLLHMITKKIRLQLKSLGILFICFFLTEQAMAQTATLRGSVKDANGLPMAGASVLLDGTRRGTVTDASGNYELKVAPGSYTLIISYVGVVTQRKQITVTGGSVSENNFEMQNSGDLKRVIVVGSRSSA